MEHMPEQTIATLAAGDRFKIGRRKAIVIENTGSLVRYSLLRASGEPFTPVYALRNMSASVEVTA